MMHIKHENCPTCGAGLTSRREFNKHCNGNWNERVEFYCGHVIEFSPNFMVASTSTECSNSAEAKARKLQRSELEAALRETIEKSTADTPYKEHLLRCLDGAKYA